jgi:hypothetical protein
VYAIGKRWQARITCGGKLHYLGTFDTQQEAALAYDRAAREHVGGKKILNYESITAAEDAVAQAQAEHTLVHDLCAEPKHGVTAQGKWWQARVKNYHGGKNYHIGTFNTKQEATVAYDRAVRENSKEKPMNYASIMAAEEAAPQAQAEHTLAHVPECSAIAQAQARHTNVTRTNSGFYGVYASKKRWIAGIYHGGKSHRIGTFDTKQEAALAYDKAARERGGGKKKLNYESIEAAEEAAAEAQAEHTLVYHMCAEPKHRLLSGFCGVYAQGKRWKTAIYHGGKQHYLGAFDTKQEAALAYDRAARGHSGGKKRLNYESIEAAEEAAAQAQAEHTRGPKSPQPTKPRPPSGFHGVTAFRKKWRAMIYYGSKQHYIGSFDTKQEAALAYDRAARERRAW